MKNMVNFYFKFTEYYSTEHFKSEWTIHISFVKQETKQTNTCHKHLHIHKLIMK